MSTNFKGEEFPKKVEEVSSKIDAMKNFDKKIEDIEFNKTLKDVLSKENQKVIPETGAYFFYDTEKEKIVYVGVSRNIKSRLQQHTNHKASNSASLAYLMEKKEIADKNNWTKPEDWEVERGFWSDLKEKFENNDEFREIYQYKIKKFKVDFLEFDNNFEMALFEIYAAKKLESYWNSFKTH